MLKKPFSGLSRFVTPKICFKILFSGSFALPETFAFIPIRNQMKPQRASLIYLVVVLFFLLLASAVWMYFEHKGQELELKKSEKIEQANE